MGPRDESADYILLRLDDAPFARTEKVFFERDLRPVRLRAGNDGLVLAWWQHVVAEDHHAHVAGVHDTQRLHFAKGERVGFAFAGDVGYDVVDCDLGHLLRWVAGLGYPAGDWGLTRSGHVNCDASRVDVFETQVLIAIRGLDEPGRVGQPGGVPHHVDPNEAGHQHRERTVEALAGLEHDRVFEDLSNARARAPLVTEIYETFIGGTFNIVNVTALMFAIPVTVLCKLATGKAPYGGKEKLAQASTIKVAAGLGMGIFDIISGFTSAYSTMMAGSDPVSPKTRDGMWTLSVILKTGSFIEAVLQPVIIKDDAAELLVTTFSALKSFGQLIMKFIATNTRQAEILLEAFYGVIKWVAGGLEIAGGEKSNGSALVLEGTGAVCQLGGYAVGNPVVYGGAAVVSALFYQAAAVVRIASI